MNITLAAKESLIKKARAYAQKHNTTLNKLIRDYLIRLVENGNHDSDADYFLALTKRVEGDSKGWTWNREDIYEF
ncbi:MAG: hypothetical protein IIB95_03725 [Candidatus Marinimicrobia bacterium]|nr:hypothetical protein [Candidatus Neomarinimicrobiota bacterium]MCH7762833.1 hypothetical protein [Candidatus Neomarinimicrobiota bacterium]